MRIVKGDVTLDGRITIEDLIVLQEAILGRININQIQEIAGDVGGDGRLTSADLLRIQKHILGMKMINEVVEYEV